MVLINKRIMHFRRRAFARNVDFSFIVSGSEKTFTFHAVPGKLSCPEFLVISDNVKPKMAEIAVHCCLLSFFDKAVKTN